MARNVCLILFFSPLFLWGQSDWVLSYAHKDSLFYYVPSKKYASKKAIRSELIKLKNKKIKKGYVLSSIDSIQWKNDTAYVTFYLGRKFNNIHITYSPEDHYIIKKTPQFNERIISDFPFRPKMIVQLLSNITHYLNNNGHPFAKTFLTIKKITPQKSTAQLHIQKGPFVKFNNIHIKGTSKIKKKYIENAILIKEGQPYNAMALKNISQKLDQIQFIGVIKPYEILFTPEGADLYLYLSSKSVSSINGIIGMQPNPTTHKTLFTGDIQLHLINVLKQGESFLLQWRSLRPKTQDLNVEFQFPFLFNIPFGVNTKFKLYKADSTYLNLNFHLGILYYLSGGTYIKAFYNSKKSSLLKDQNTFSNSIVPTSENNYGLGFVRNHLDYLPNPSKGLQFSIELSVGRRKSTPKKDSTLTSTIYSGGLSIAYYFPITPRNVIKVSNQTRTYIAPTIYYNELLRFGGLKTQRGFDEEALRATTLTTFSLEYRFLVDKNSHAFAFFDQTIYEKNSSDYIKDTPFGFGVGYSFGTGIGIFSISYALGKQFDNPIQLRNGKIHFGYIAYF